VTETGNSDPRSRSDAEPSETGAAEHTEFAAERPSDPEERARWRLERRAAIKAARDAERAAARAQIKAARDAERDQLKQSRAEDRARIQEARAKERAEARAREMAQHEAALRAAKQAGHKAGQAAAHKAAPNVIEVAPIALPAHMRPRHWGILLSFLFLVLIPLTLSGWYLSNRAVDQYGSIVGFTIRQEDGGGASDILGGLAAQVSGGSGQADTDILYEFIQSQTLVAQMESKFGLRRLYSAPYDSDPIFALKPDASLEELVEYWQRILRISYDESARLIELRVLAFDPALAQAIAQDIVTRSQTLINELNGQARADTIRYAQGDLAEAQERLRIARSALILFRTRTQLVDPETDLQGRMGVVNTLQQQLAEALIELDLLIQSTNQSDPRVVQARRRIEVIRNRISQERLNVASGGDSASGEDYPTLLAEYETLLVDREFAEKSYTAALAALDVARANAARQSRYLATYVAPTLPETSEYPRRWTLFGLAALFLVLSWSILVLIYYSVRDSR
jgi:capsular polysaccharide transport system permease protein